MPQATPEKGDSSPKVKSSLDEWTTRIFAYLGGLLAIFKVWELLIGRPKIIGEVEQAIFGTISDRNTGELIGANLMLQLYLVARINPTTIKGWGLTVEIDGKKRQADHILIEDSLVLNDSKGQKIPVDWKISRLPDIAWNKVLEHEKPIRGWIRFRLRGIHGDSLKGNAKLIITMTDAMGRKHWIK
jgi:hypothetical protein